jgi:phage anti-repressor protein
MPNLAINEKMVSELLNSSEEFPIDFEMAWQWAGYTNKRNAANKLKAHFEDGLEFSIMLSKNPEGGRPSVSYSLTNDCFKMFCMMAGTGKGKEVRRYYIECEKRLKINQGIQVAVPIAPSLDTEQRISILSEASRLFGLSDSPRHMQLIRDRVANLLNDQAAPIVASEPRWMGVTEVAEDLGYKPSQVAKVGSQLGKVVAAWYRAEFNADPLEEERIFNGRMTDLKVYQRSEDLDGIVMAYLNQKGLSNLAIAQSRGAS